MIIDIKVASKRAYVIGTPIIICGNSDYTIQFDFDEEWAGVEGKTARFVYVQDSTLKHRDVVFAGNTVAVPILSNIREAYVGVYAGDLQTTTPARINCDKSILCGDSVHEDPPEDVYNQIMALIASKITVPNTAEVGQTVVVKSVDSNGKPMAWEAADLPIIAHFAGLDGDPVMCSDYTHQEIMDFIRAGKIVFAHVAFLDDHDYPKSIEIHQINADYDEGMSNIGTMGNYGWNHYENNEACFADGNTSNKTAGNELWHMF